MPRKNSARIPELNAGTASICSGGMWATRLMRSATTAISPDDPPSGVSTTTRLSRRERPACFKPNFRARSTTATAAPRTLTTPRSRPGVPGTRVRPSSGAISATRASGTPYSSSPRKNVRYAASAAA